MLLVIGSNTTEAHPVISYYMKRAVKKGATLIVCDPRRIDLVRWATMHVQHRVGTDVALLNGLMHEILANGWEDRDFIEQHTEKFDELREVVKDYPLERASEITRRARRAVARGGPHPRRPKSRPASATRSASPSTPAARTTSTSCANLQMLLGNLGMPSAGVNPLRGQNNVQGACDMGALPNVFHNYQPASDPSRAREVRPRVGRAGPAGRARPAHARHVLGHARRHDARVHLPRRERGDERAERGRTRATASRRSTSSSCWTSSRTRRRRTPTSCSRAPAGASRTAPSRTPSAGCSGCAPR